MAVWSGKVGEYRWEAYLARGPVSHGLDPGSLLKGRGRIVRMTLYTRVGQTAVWRKAAAFHRGWLFGRSRHLAAIRQVVEHLRSAP